MRLLSRREHSREELRGKLVSRGFDAAAIEAVLDELRAGGWQSDARFAEQYAAARGGRGYGPLRIREELRLRGVGEEVRAGSVDDQDPAWQDRARRALRRRFGESPPAGHEERAGRMRFLIRRGYGAEPARRAVDDDA